MRVIFAGTPIFSAVTLKALLQSQHKIIAVYTQPDRPAGRGRVLTASPVKELALQHQLPVFQPLTLRDENEQKKLADLQADLMIVVAYGLILPKNILQTPKLGCVNVHASLLPRWRGAAPIQRAILAGDAKTGITIMQMDEGLDTGAMLLKSECEMTKTDTTETLHDRLANLGAQTLLQALENFSQLKPEKQNDSLATYAQKIKKDEAKINWNLSADEIERQVRAFNPWPVAFFGEGDKTVRVWEAKMISTQENFQSGVIVAATSEGIYIATGKNILRLLKIQLPGGKILPVADILHSRANEFVVGKQL
jgi:methionyl-tRNA formyltransferase